MSTGFDRVQLDQYWVLLDNQGVPWEAPAPVVKIFPGGRGAICGTQYMTLNSHGYPALSNWRLVGLACVDCRELCRQNCQTK